MKLPPQEMTGGDPKTKVFISYSRSDMAFADRLEAGLETCGLACLIDRTDIYAFEDWWKRIQGLISEADAVVFVLSPQSVSSSVCRQEIEYAASLNKRLAPIVCRPVQPDAVIESLRRLNFIGFEDETLFDASLGKLVEALQTDIQWVRQHTEFGMLAQRWTASGRARGLLLGSVMLETAERWIVSRPRGAPSPTEDTQAFIAESRRAAQRRRNLLTGSLLVGLVATSALAALAYWQRGIAVEQRQAAERSEARATQERDRALLTQSRFLADLANQRVAADDGGTGLLLALEALPDPANGIERPYAPEAEAAVFGARAHVRDLTVYWGPGVPMLSAVFSPDGRAVLVGFRDGTARILDVQTYKTNITLTGHTGPVLGASFSPDGKRVVTASRDHTARVWDVETGDTIALLKGHENVVNAAAFSPDGRRVVTASADGSARIWDPVTSSSLVVLTDKSGAVNTAEFSPDGRLVVTTSRGGHLWDAETGKPVSALTDESGDIQSAAFSPDGQQVVMASGDHTARIWDVTTGKVIGVLAGHTDRLRSAAYSRDGRRIVTASYDGTARVWDSQTRQVIATLNGHGEMLWGASFSPDGRRVVTVALDKTVRVWAVDLGSAPTILQGSGMILDAQFDTAGRQIITASDDGAVQLRDAASLRTTGQLNVGPILSAAISPDGRRIAIASGNTAQILDVQTGKSAMVLAGHSDRIWSVAFSPDGRRLVSAALDKTARIWDLQTGSTIGVLEGHARTVNCAAFSPDGKRVVTASDDGVARIWDAENFVLLHELRGHNLIGVPVAVTRASFSPDGRRILTASYDHTARIWDTDSGSLISILSGHTEIVWSARFSPDQRRVITASRDKTARIWDVTAGKTIALLDGDTQDVWDADFSPDGLRVITGSFDKSTRLWRLFPTTKALVEDAKAALPRCLTRQQRERFFLDPEPPAWCIATQKWPYHTDIWKDWLARKQAGENPPLPDTPRG